MGAHGANVHPAVLSGRRPDALWHLGYRGLHWRHRAAPQWALDAGQRGTVRYRRRAEKRVFCGIPPARPFCLSLTSHALCSFDIMGEGWVAEAPLTTKRARFGAAAIGDVVCVVRHRREQTVWQTYGPSSPQRAPFPPHSGRRRQWHGDPAEQCRSVGSEPTARGTAVKNAFRALGARGVTPSARNLTPPSLGCRCVSGEAWRRSASRATTTR